MAALLLDETGFGLARRYSRTFAVAHPFRLSSSTGQQLLAHGERPARVVSLAEAMATAEPLASLVTRPRRGRATGQEDGVGPQACAP
jgi:hypothetical protein